MVSFNLFLYIDASDSALLMLCVYYYIGATTIIILWRRMLVPVFTCLFIFYCSSFTNGFRIISEYSKHSHNVDPSYLYSYPNCNIN